MFYGQIVVSECVANRPQFRPAATTVGRRPRIPAPAPGRIQDHPQMGRPVYIRRTIRHCQSCSRTPISNRSNQRAPQYCSFQLSRFTCRQRISKLAQMQGPGKRCSEYIRCVTFSAGSGPGGGNVAGGHSPLSILVRSPSASYCGDRSCCATLDEASNVSVQVTIISSSLRSPHLTGFEGSGLAGLLALLS